jgi:hypothetical protein
MIQNSTAKQVGTVRRDETVGKVFTVVSEDARRCLVCDQLFTRKESFDHSQMTCYPPSSNAN